VFRNAALAALALLSGGCLHGGGPATITRTVGGESRRGIFVSPHSYEHFVRGELARLRGDLEQAAEAYRLARAGPEDDPLLIARLAEVTDRLGREAEAMALLEQGAELDPEAEVLWLTRGRIHERHGRVEEAIEAYSRAASAAPRSEAGPLALAALLRRTGRPDEADAVLERYLERARGAGAARARLALAVEQGRAQAAAEAVRALLAVAPARAGEVRAAARTALERDRPELALRLLEALPPAAPEDRPLRLAAALAAGDTDRAEGILASWMPEGPGELLEVAEGYLAVGRPERAVELARVAASAEAGPAADLVLGRGLRAAGRPDEAAAVLARLHPGSQAWPEAPIELAAALRDVGRPALAADVLARAQRRRPSAPLALALAEARAAAGDEAGALAALEGDDVRLRAARARWLETLGRVRAAAELYAALPDDAPGLDRRARVRARVERRWRAGEREAALELLRGWVERAPEDLLARARRAELLAAAGRAGAAREVAGEALPLAVEAPLRRRLTALVASTASGPRRDEG
jgi:tetratricopeptide (TPR) repeat protein